MVTSLACRPGRHRLQPPEVGGEPSARRSSNTLCSIHSLVQSWHNDLENRCAEPAIPRAIIGQTLAGNPLECGVLTATRPCAAAEFTCVGVCSCRDRANARPFSERRGESL